MLSYTRQHCDFQTRRVKHMRAIWNSTVLAHSNETIELEGNHYFPPDSLKKKFFRKSDFHTSCPWKGEASYYDIVVKGAVNHNAAWYYPNPKEAARNITGYVAFWNGVQVKEK